MLYHRFDFAIDPRQIRVVDVSDSKREYNNSREILLNKRQFPFFNQSLDKILIIVLIYDFFPKFCQFIHHPGIETNFVMNCNIHLTNNPSYSLEVKYDFVKSFHVFIADFNNAFTISFPERDWLLQAKNKEDKMSYMSLLSEISASALPDSCKLLSKR